MDSLSFVTTVTRRSVSFRGEDGAINTAYLPPGIDQVVVGDRVIVEGRVKEGTLHTIKEVAPRKNLFKRAHGPKEKLLAANLDLLFLVISSEPLTSTLYIDRILTAAEYENIPVTILFNKIDLCTAEKRGIFDLYKELGIPLLETSAKFSSGIKR